MKLDRADITGCVREQTPRFADVGNPIGQSSTSYPLAVDFCCGLGGLSLAARQLGMTVIAGVDTDSDSLKTFSRNFPGAVAIEATIGGKRAIEGCVSAASGHFASNAPLIVLSGPPCQGFSAAGSRDPSDKRNKILLGVARAIKALRPVGALVENVQELLTDKHRKRVKDFEKHLRDAGYRVLPIELDAKDYGVPQKRRRAFFLVTRKQLDEASVMQRFASLRKAEVPCADRLEDLPLAEVRGAAYSDDDELRRATPNHLAMRHSQAVQDKIAAISVGGGPMSYRKLDPTKPANTLFSGHRAPPVHYKYPRSITVREAARLQGFPDDFRIYGSFANQMAQVTNAVPPPLARTVLQVLAELTDLGHCHDG
ncbi:MAG: DNA cytosine methyltransferase [Betaproteobacteria bacterium]|nr:DNA cytosine methyltransferase [Betaproteobacteria bacterium]